MTEDSDEENPASVPAAFVDRITASLRRLGTTVEVAPEEAGEAAHHLAGTGGAVSLGAAADSTETGSAAETEASTIQCPVCLDTLTEIKRRGRIASS